MTKKQEAERAEQIEGLRPILKPGCTIYTVLKHRARSGMYRVLDVFVFVPNDAANIEQGGEPCIPLRITWSAAIATGAGYDQRHEGIRAQGCGLDVGFEVAYHLGHALFPNGVPCCGKNCHSNDHHNGDRGYTPGKIHSDGGYAFNHRWL